MKSWEEVRRDFPLLAEHPELAYLDSAATAQRPACVIAAEADFYRERNANPLRGLYALSQSATQAYEDAREAVRGFIGARSAREIVFTRNASESLNLISYSWCDAFLRPGDEIVVSILEHHSNLLPWQRAARRAGAALRFVECGPDGTITRQALAEALSPRTRLVCMTQLSNVLGVELPVKEFAALAHEAGALFVCDGAQSVPHMPVDVAELDVDFLAFSGHKMGGPMGIGVLYGKQALFEQMPPFLYGGEMIESVTRDSAVFAELPHKFEAGTVNAAGAAGLAEAVRYYRALGWEAITRREAELSRECADILGALPHVRLLGPREPELRHGIFSFTVDGVHPHDVAAVLDASGVAVRAGHHCAQPLLRHLGVSSTARASLAFYNTPEDLRRLGEALAHIRETMGYGD